MAQMIYGIIALMLLALLALSVNQSKVHSEQKMIFNEVATQMTGIGTDVLEHIGRMTWDEATDETTEEFVENPEYPLVQNASELTPESQFGGCTDFVYEFGSCDTINDYHGLEFEREVGGLMYTVDIQVYYVDENTLEPSCSEPPCGQNSFAKKVKVTITNPYVRMADDPLEVNMARVFTYNRHTDI